MADMMEPPVETKVEEVAAGAGKKKKEKKKKEVVNLNDFLADESAGSGSWADAMDEAPGRGGSSFGGGDFSGGYGGGGGGHDLPSGPSRGFDNPQAEVPERGPFKAYVGNLSYDATVDTLGNFFADGGCKVVDVRMVMDRETQRPKGFGYVEFEDRASLMQALEANGVDLDGRQIRVDVATSQQNDRGGGFGSSRFGSDRDWGSARSHRDDHGGDRGGYGSRGGYGDRGGFGGDRGGFGDRGGYGDRGGHGGGFNDRGGGFNDRGAAPAAERPRLQLQKRSVPADKPSQGGASKSSPFGDAAPRDEEAAQRKIKEDRQAREARVGAPDKSGEAPKKQEEKKPPQKARSSPFGDAKPVQVKEKEDLKVSRAASAPGDEEKERKPARETKSKFGAWGAKEEKKEAPAETKEVSPAAPTAAAPAWGAKETKAKPTPAPVKKDKKQGPVNAFDALADEEDEE